MKKLFFVIVALIFSASIMAQDLSMGIKAGINYGATKTSDADINAKFDPILAPMFGFYAEFMLSDEFGIQPELLYSPSGNRMKDVEAEGIGTGKSTVKSTLNYLNIPVMFKYYVNDALSLEAGPYLGFLLSAKMNGKLDFDGNDYDQSYDNIDVKKHFNSTDFGAGIGAAYKMDNGLNIGVRYNLGLSDIRKEVSTGTKATTTDYTIKNNIFQFSVGYSFM